jgi:hypothetical protein
VLVLVVLAVIVLAVGAFLASRSYGTVESLGGFSGPIQGQATRMVWDEPLGSRSMESMVVDGRKDGSFRFHFDVTNTGRLPLTFDRYESDPVVIARVSDVRISTRSYEESDGRPEYRPLDGARLEPGESRAFEVTATWRAICDGGLAEDSTTSMSGFPLRYGYGPFHRTQQFEMPFDFVLICGKLPPEN